MKKANATGNKIDEYLSIFIPVDVVTSEGLAGFLCLLAKLLFVGDIIKAFSRLSNMAMLPPIEVIGLCFLSDRLFWISFNLSWNATAANSNRDIKMNPMQANIQTSIAKHNHSILYIL